MNSETRSAEGQEPLYTFRCETKGFDIALIPHSEQDRARLTLQADQEGVSVAQFVQDEILKALSSGLDQTGVATG